VSSALQRLRQEGAPLAVLSALSLVYLIVFGWLTWQQQRNYATFGFDMGIHDQGIWLLSRFKNPYVTVVGRDYLGHHFNLVAFLYVPFSWLGAGPKFLYFTETLALAAGAVPVYLLARDQLGNKWLGTAFGAAYLLHPTIQWINWWHFHPDALMITPLLFAWWFATRERWRSFAICCLLAVMAKEDATTAVVMMGVVLTVRHWRTDKRIGLFTMRAGVVPRAPSSHAVVQPRRARGLRDFFLAWAGLGGSCNASARAGVRPLGAAPRPASATAGQAAFRSDVYHYCALLLPMFMSHSQADCCSSAADARDQRDVVAVVPRREVPLLRDHRRRGCARFDRRVPSLSKRLGYLVAWRRALFALTQHRWSPSPLADATHHSGVWARPWRTDAPSGTPARDHMVALVPGDAGVSATYSLIPHLTHRTIAYEFPNPWWVTNWLDCKTSPQPEKVDMLVVDTAVLGTARSRFGMAPRSSTRSRIPTTASSRSSARKAASSSPSASPRRLAFEPASECE
jgi:hypothetical protein